MSDAIDDAMANEALQSTYCKKHPGRWHHECGCEPDYDDVCDDCGAILVDYDDECEECAY